MINWIQWSPLVGVLGLVTAGFIYIALKHHSDGNERMRGLEKQIHDGAMVFLRREYTILVFFNL